MTLGFIIFIIAIIATVIIIVDWKAIYAEDIFNSIGLGVIIGVIAWILVALIGGIIVYQVNKNDPYNVVATEKIEIEAAKIEPTGKSGSVSIIYTDTDMHTNRISIHDANLVNTDTENPYFIKETLETKCHFISHIFDTTTYTYYGNVKDLYK